ncbi:hypothetical protein A2Y83_03050 [Candidatus Falkowbacteria bacterium RBG_13_39_14]|uniref:Uncharacterized protein n=1 Tax=Candidatus Falkowbacteria bacterium RBG_13_39_14 TaxID=1797985 RepID=A0A1F5S4D9_9BACT|nr:MAG: hypothetical protein A2Y83_03050 [Candidatus Falkowbacteria bacterium RBG_13_39_14]
MLEIKQKKYLGILIFVIILIFLNFYFLKDPNFAIKNKFVDYTIRIFFLLLLIYFVIYLMSLGTSTIVLKQVLKEVSGSTGMKLKRPKGIKKLGIPLTVFYVLEGEYREYPIIITPMLSPSLGYWKPWIETFTCGYVDLIIELGPLAIDYANPLLKESGKQFLMKTPDTLKLMSYKFEENMSILNDKLVLTMKYKCPRNSKDLIYILDVLIDEANKIAVSHQRSGL